MPPFLRTSHFRPLSTEPPVPVGGVRVLGLPAGAPGSVAAAAASRVGPPAVPCSAVTVPRPRRGPSRCSAHFLTETGSFRHCPSQQDVGRGPVQTHAAVLSGRLGASPIYCSARHHPKTWRLKTIIHIYYLTHLLSHSWEWLGWWLRLGCPLRSQLSERGFSSR